VSFEGVARRARTSKPVLYRRYRSRAHLVIDAWSALAPLALPSIGSGSLRDDLVDILSAVSARFQRIDIDAFRRVLAEADDELLEEITAFTWASAKESIDRIHREARGRGELGDAPLDKRVTLLPLVLLRHELFFTRGVLTERAVAELVDQVCLPLLVAASRRQTAS
jgi:AcrR family transcriptional regulator